MPKSKFNVIFSSFKILFGWRFSNLPWTKMLQRTPTNIQVFVSPTFATEILVHYVSFRMVCRRIKNGAILWREHNNTTLIVLSAINLGKIGVHWQIGNGNHWLWWWSKVNATSKNRMTTGFRCYLFVNEFKKELRMWWFSETKDTVRVSLQEYLFTGSSKATFLWILAEKSTVIGPPGRGGLTVLQEPTLTVLLALPRSFAARSWMYSSWIPKTTRI